MEKLHPGARWSFRIGAYFMLIFLFFVLVMWVGLSFEGISIGTAAIIGIIILIIAGEIYARMSYTRWFYEFNNEGLKTERGIIWKRYTNVPYNRIQNVDIKRGIIARMCGFSSVYIQTAGFSGQQPFSEGYLPAVEVSAAEHIRNYLMKRISKRR